jgi:protein-tyrosine-phosphatase
MHILFVCSGNTCRSPLAAALFRALLAEFGRSEIAVSSAGTGAYDGAPASEGAFLVALESSLDLSDHRARLLDREVVASANLILAMSRGHVTRVERLGGGGKVYLLGDYAGRADPDAEVRDPYGGDVETYRATLRQLQGLLSAARSRFLVEHPS